MSIYCIADTHLSLAVPKPMDVFGNRWRDYVTKLKSRWNSVVSESDTVIVPGDISWGLNLEEAAEDIRFLSALNGKKIIGKGNHDLWWQSEKKLKEFFASEKIDNIYLLHNNAYEVENLIICGSRGWFYDPKSSPPGADPEKISAREVIRTELSLKAANALDPEGTKEKLMFFHFPPVFKDFICAYMIELLKRHGIKRCFYGHIHTSYYIPRTFEHEGIEMSIVSADYLDFIPLKIN
jgi:predicted phosphohydrolase